MHRRWSISSLLRSLLPERLASARRTKTTFARRFSAKQWVTLSVEERMRRCRSMSQEALAIRATDNTVTRHHYSELAMQWNELAEELQSQIAPGELYRKHEAGPSDHRAGKWEYLDGLEEFAHYAIIAGYYARLSPRGSVLDLGCGAGLMQRMLLPHNYSRYLGIDISPDAIERATRDLSACPAHPDTTFRLGDLEQPLEETVAPFDVIIMNEALYYVENPTHVLSQLAQQTLAPNGIIIISMWHSLNSRRLWSLLARHGWHPHDVTTVRNKAGTTWKICVFQPLGTKRPENPTA
jgi:2-polyprenyl-3-methyl-5-hydroxy-6-metoxy-1,4-benzoquinol methylase